MRDEQGRIRWPDAPPPRLDNDRDGTYRTSAMAVRCTQVERESRGVGGWLADEVVVDFPAIDGAVERMRRAFFGPDHERGATHTAEVALTPKEAGEGTRVPLDLPVRQTCPICGGRGEVWSEPCGLCAGAGCGLLSHQLDLRVPQGVRDGARLRFRVQPPFAPETRVEVRIAVP